MKLLLLLFSAIALSSCAVISSSQYDTAESLGENKSELGAGIGFGRDVGSGVYFEADAGDFPVLIMEGFGRHGLTDRIDIGGKAWIALGSVGLQGHGKFRFSQDGSRIQAAVAPGVSWTGSDVEFRKDNQRVFASAFSFHLPLIVSVHPTKHLSFYGGLQYTLTSVSTSTLGMKILHTPSVTVGLRFSEGPFNLYPELSLYRFSDLIRGRAFFIFLPNLGFSFTI